MHIICSNLSLLMQISQRKYEDRGLFACHLVQILVFLHSTEGEGNNEDEEDELDGLMKSYELQAAKDLAASQPVTSQKVPRMVDRLEDGLATKLDSANKYD